MRRPVLASRHASEQHTRNSSGATSSGPPQRDAASTDAGNTAARWFIGAALIVYAAAFLRHFLADGLPIFFDAHSHLARSWMTYEALADASLPLWSNAWYGGYRLLEFYGPLYYLVTGSVGWILGDVFVSTKLCLWLGQCVATAGFYFLAVRITQRPLIAAATALLFLHGAQRLVLMEIVGNFPTLLLLALTPWLMGQTLRFCARQEDPALSTLRFVALRTLLLAALLAGHLAHALILLPSLLVFECVLVLESVGPQRLRIVGALALSTLLALALTAAVSVPALFAHGDVSLALVDFGLGARRGAAALAQSIGLHPWSVDLPFAAPQGGMALGLALVGVGSLLGRRSAGARAATAGVATSGALTLALGERAAVSLIFFVLPLAAWGLATLTSQLTARLGRAPEGLLPASAVAAALLLPHVGALPDAHYEPETRLAIYRALPETQWPGRTFDVTPSRISLDGFYGWSSVSPALSGRAVVFGAFPQAAPLASNVQLALFGRLARDLARQPPRLGGDALDLLYLANVAFLVDRGSPALLERLTLDGSHPWTLRRMQVEPGSGALERPDVFRLAHHGPAVFAPLIEALPQSFARPRALAAARPQLLAVLEEEWSRTPLGAHEDRSLDLLFRTGARDDAALLLPLLRALELDRRHARAARFFVEDPTSLGAPRSPTAAADEARLELLAHEENARRVRVALRTSHEGFVRVAYAWDPALQVELDGAAAAVAVDALTGALILRVPAGEHEIVLRGGASPLQSALVAWMGLGSVGLLALYALGGRR